jgi:hypothetical protein
VTADDGDEALELPRAFLATTRNVYAVLLLKDEMVHEVDEVEQVAPPGLAVTV